LTDFKKWYAKEYPDRHASSDDAYFALRQAYKSGVASQSKTLRDKFAGQALSGIASGGGWAQPLQVAGIAYQIADAMLKKRGTLKKGAA
jgi:hypothetical protein